MRIVAGDSFEFVSYHPDFSDQESQAVFILQKDANIYTFSGERQDNGNFLFKISPSESSQFEPGEYFGFIRYSRGTSKASTISLGQITVLPNPASSDVTASHIKKILLALEAAIEGRASRTDLEYQIGDKRIKHMTLEELYKAWRLYKELYKQELLAKGLSDYTGNIVKVRFKE